MIYHGNSCRSLIAIASHLILSHLDMADQKQQEANAHAAPPQREEEVPPPYEIMGTNQAAPSSSADAKTRTAHPAAPSGPGPTVESPFNFPSGPAPSYAGIAAGAGAGPSSPSAVPGRPIALPQERPNPAAGFLTAYAPVLLSHGIPPDTWHSFVATLSAFLTAKVSDRALAHAADMARELGRGPKSFGKGTADHVKAVGQDLKQNAKQGNIFGVATGVIGGIISIPVGTAVRAVGAIVNTPGHAVAAAAKKPQTPRERAVAYLVTANRKWFAPRGLVAQLLDTRELAGLLRTQPSAVLEMANAGKDAAAKMQAMAGLLAQLDVPASASLEVSEATLWLVLTQQESPYN